MEFTEKEPTQSASWGSSIYMDFILEQQSLRSSVASSVSGSENDSLKSSCFSDLEKNILAAVLQNCMDELQVLLYVFPFNVKSVNIKSIFYSTLQDRIEGDYRKFDDTEQVLTNEEKFQRDLFTLCHMIKKSQSEICRHANYMKFMTILDGIERTKEDEASFLIEYKCNLAYQQDLKELLVDQRKYFREQMFKMNEQVRGMEAEFGYTKAVMRFKSRYIDEWEKSRQSQNEQIQTTLCNDYVKEIKGFKKRIKSENVAHTEIEKFMKEQCEEYMDSIESWSNLYEEEIERRDMEIYNLNTRRELLKERFIALEKEYEDRKKAIVEWLAYKEVKRKEEEERLRRENAAIRIQAWWRGTMVRRCLGKYRKKKKKGKGKKGKGGKDAKGKGGKGNVGKAKKKK